MSIMLVTYDHGKIYRTVDRVPEFFKGYNHIKLYESTSAIENYEKTRTIFNKIMPFYGSNAHLHVVTLIKPFSSPVLTPMSEWLWKNLPEE